MLDKKDIEFLQQKISKEINRNKNYKSIWDSIALKTLETINNRLEKIKTISLITKYDILFIGQVGVGKTTAICHLFNFVYEHKQKKKIKKGDKVEYKTITSIKEILSTGSGKTTICEVIIKPAVETYIEISPYSEEDMIELIKDFCLDIWQQVYPDGKSEDSLKLSSTELIRAIRNIVHLKEIHSKGNYIDEAAQLAKDFSSSQLNNFIKEVIKRAKLHLRKQTKFDCREEFNSAKINDVKAEKEWIKDKFYQINLGKINTCLIPQKIIIYVSPNIIDFEQYPKLNSIIDTKGIDEVKIRKDLESYIRDNDQTICIFTESFKSAPSNVSELIKRYLTSESKDIDTKFALIILPQKGEPEKLFSSDGQVEDGDEGIAVRKSQIEDSFRQQKIQFIPDNIFFYDAKQFYLNDGRVDPDYDKSDIESEKQILINKIYSLIERRENKLHAEVSQLEQLFLQIQNGNILEPEDKKLLNNLKKNIQELEIIEYHKYELTSEYILFLRSYHVTVFRAINNRHGKYDVRDIDIYFECKNVAEDLVRKNLQELKNQILGAINLTKKDASDKSGLASILEFIKKEVDACYEEIVISLGSQISDKLENEILKPQDESNIFWSEVKGRWGQGLGYRDDVLCMYDNEMKDIDYFFRHEIQNLWQQKLRNEILSFFDDEYFE